jgi:hypothetical protein
MPWVVLVDGNDTVYGTFSSENEADAFMELLPGSQSEAKEMEDPDEVRDQAAKALAEYDARRKRKEEPK